MKYVPMQTGMWAVFAGSFRNNLEAVFDLDPKTAGAVTAAAKKQYRRILRELPDFEKGDRFLMNIVSCAMLAAFILSMPERPNVEHLREYYERSMMTPAMRVYSEILLYVLFSTHQKLRAPVSAYRFAVIPQVDQWRQIRRQAQIMSCTSS